MRLYLSSLGLGNRPRELLRLLHGRRRVGVIANASDFHDAGARRAACAREQRELATLGLEPVEIDLRDFFDRPAGEVAGALAEVDALWASGGNAFLLRQGFRRSGLELVLRDALDGGLVYGGYSAGGVVLGPTLRGIELVDDAYAVPPGYEPEVVWDGLGLLPYTFVPHHRSEDPESRDVIDRLVEHLIAAHEPFIALADGDAIVHDGPARTVVG